MTAVMVGLLCLSPLTFSAFRDQTNQSYCNIPGHFKNDNSTTPLRIQRVSWHFLTTINKHYSCHP